MKVPGFKVRTAFFVFATAQGEDFREARLAFKRIIHIEHLGKPRYELTDKQARLVEAVCGPHGHTYCKMLIAKFHGSD